MLRLSHSLLHSLCSLLNYWLASVYNVEGCPRGCFLFCYIMGYLERERSFHCPLNPLMLVSFYCKCLILYTKMLPLFSNLNVINFRKTMTHGKDEPMVPLNF